MPFSGLVWFLLMLAPLVFLQRFLHREIQFIFYILTRNQQLSLALFSILFFPGVVLHESSHFLMAKMLGVRTGRFSVFPRTLPNGRLQMGYVETVQSDFFRDSLIGLAPLIAGTLFIAYAGIAQLQLHTLWTVLRNAQMGLFWTGVTLLPKQPDFYVWFYLTFAISSTMLPSESDRHAWLPLGIWVGILFLLVAFSGAGAWLLENLTPFFDNLFNSVALLFMLSDIVHMVLLIPLYVFRQGLLYLNQVLR